MRFNKIDIMKGLLALQMILGHCLQFYGNQDFYKASDIIIRFVNLSTFSGFLFCFGYVSYTAYFSKDFKVAFPKLMKNFVRLLMAYYVSSFAYVIYVEGMTLRMDSFLEILLFRRLAGWSEFLLSFALLILLEIILFPMLKRGNDIVILVLAAVSLASVFITKATRAPIVASLIDGNNGAFFPVITFAFYFLMGMLVARNVDKNQKRTLGIWGVASVAGTAYYVVNFVVTGNEPSRFPLSLAYLIGGMLIVFIYYMLSMVMEKWDDTLCVKEFIRIGKNSLAYLLISNILIFSIRATRFYVLKIGFAFGLYIALLVLIWYFTLIYRKMK